MDTTGVDMARHRCGHTWIQQVWTWLQQVWTYMATTGVDIHGYNRWGQSWLQRSVVDMAKSVVDMALITTCIHLCPLQALDKPLITTEATEGFNSLPKYLRTPPY
eukprot:5287276-Pyramimonas_sp.AAC.1